MRAPSLAGATAVGLAVAASLAAGAAANPYSLGSDVKVNGASPLTACPFGASADFASAYSNSEVEPQVAVNPTNPAQIVGVSQQDRWPDGGARGLPLLVRARVPVPRDGRARCARVSADRCVSGRL